MGKNSREAKNEKQKLIKKQKMRQNLLTGAAFLLGVIILVTAKVIVTAENTAHQNLTATLSEDGSLHIDRAALKEGVFNYVDWGGPQELIIMPKEDGVYAAGLDTCESCHVEYEGNVHFTRDGKNMVCQACKSVLDLEDFGLQEWGGCKPLAIPAAARQDTDDEIVISAEGIQFALDMLAQWDTGDQTVTFVDFGKEEESESTDDSVDADSEDGEESQDDAAVNPDENEESQNDAAVNPDESEESQDDAAVNPDENEESQDDAAVAEAPETTDDVEE